MIAQPLRRSVRAAAAAGLLAAGAWAPAAGAGDGFYAGAALQARHSAVEYRKSFGVAPSAPRVSRDRARGTAGALAATLGYRVFLSGRWLLAGEIEGTLRPDDGVSGVLPGTGGGDLDVWPGAWRLDSRGGLGVNARLGYAPRGAEILGPGRAFYLFAGLRRVEVDIAAEHRNARLGIRGERTMSRRLAPWIAGAGVEFGGAEDRFDLRLGYSAWDAEFGFAGGLEGSRLGYAFESREWSVSLAYVAALGG